MSDHDPLCSIVNCDPKGVLYVGWPFPAEGGYCEQCARECCCDVIAKVRADEREKAVSKVAAFDVQPCDDCDRSCACWRCDVHERVEDIIAAIRGEASDD